MFSNNDLVLVDQNNSTVWRANLTGGGVRSQLVAQLLDNGNLVASDSEEPEIYLWQSFDSPTDTLLPQMKLGIGKRLTSWRSHDDPGTGLWSLELKNQSGLFEMFIMLHKTMVVHRSDPWDGTGFGDFRGVLQIKSSSDWTGKAEDSNVAVEMIDQHDSRLTVGGRISQVRGEWIVEQFTWVPESKEWRHSWEIGLEQCSFYDICGTYAYCLGHETAPCSCINGFEPVSKEDWKLGNHSEGCRRRTTLSCDRGDGFSTLKNMKLPDTKNAGLHMEVGSAECEDRCLRRCDCTAFAYVDVLVQGRRGCVIWTGGLNDLRYYGDTGQELYVKLAAKDMEAAKENNANKTANLSTLDIELIVGGLLFFILSCICCCFFLWKRLKRGSAETQGPTQTEIMMTEIAGGDRFSFMDFSTIVQATDNFSESNELGRGGFGTVYKGILENGTQVAVKRLSNKSSQGVVEFRNEVRTILDVLHKNLVRLIGCCCEGVEKILVYEFLENSSLNRYIFDESQSPLLNWQNRFRIIGEIVQGLDYLHNSRDSPIIHRDLKPSNILLDNHMTAKISDFGMAKTLESGQTEAETLHAVGTYGYMSEEYQLHYVMSEKSDVFSFGVLVLEIITGQQNVKFCNSHPGISLLSLAWQSWSTRNWLQLIDPRFKDDTLVEEEVLRCIQIALCCVQDKPENRPSTDLLAMMIKSSTTDIPEPQEPNYSMPDASLMKLQERHPLLSYQR